MTVVLERDCINVFTDPSCYISLTSCLLTAGKAREAGMIDESKPVRAAEARVELFILGKRMLTSVDGNKKEEQTSSSVLTCSLV